MMNMIISMKMMNTMMKMLLNIMMNMMIFEYHNDE